MFQTDIHHFLQTFDPAWWVWIMQIVSQLGTRNFYLLAVLVILFSLEYRKGFLALQALMWANFFTVWLKEWLNMPRPYHVDADLNIFQLQTDEVRIHHGSATSFWSGLDARHLEKIRTGEVIDNGFPSGHTSTAVSFFGAVALLFSKPWVRVVCIAFILLTMLSRLFLAMHFIADILGGLLLGLLPLVVIYLFFIRGRQISTWLYFEIIKNKTWIFLFIAPWILLLLPQNPTAMVGQLLGLNLGVWLACRKGFPSSQAVWWKRVVRLLVAIALFILITTITSRVIPTSGYAPLIILRQLIEFGIFFWSATLINVKLGLFTSRLA